MYVYKTSTFTILHVLRRRISFFKRKCTVFWKEEFNLWETILEDMFVEQLFFENVLKQ